MATIRKRGDGVYEVRVFVGRDERGKPIQRSKTVRGGKRDAERVAAELETKPSRAGAKTVADALDAWVEMKMPTWAVSSKRDQVGRANALKDDPIGNDQRRPPRRRGSRQVDRPTTQAGQGRRRPPQPAPGPPLRAPPSRAVGMDR